MIFVAWFLTGIAAGIPIVGAVGYWLIPYSSVSDLRPRMPRSKHNGQRPPFRNPTA